MIKNITKILIIIFVATSLNLSFAPKAEALFGLGDIVYDPINYTINGLKLAAQHLGLLSAGLPGTGAVAKGAVTAATDGCKISEQAFRVANTSDNLTSGIAVLGGDAAQMTRLSLKIATLTAINACYDTVLQAVRHGGSIGAMSGAQALEALGMSELELSGIVIAYDDRIMRLTEQRDAALKSMWEGVAYRVLATVQQQVTGRLINKLVAKYKIGNYLKYADAVATQIYTADFVTKNFPDKADQLMIRSILMSDGFNAEVMPFLQKKANDALGFLPEKLDLADPAYYQKMALAGTGSANPFYLKSVYEAKAGMTSAEAEAQAQQEISQGQGFIPARNCNAVLSQESAKLDAQTAALGKDVAVKMAAFNKLQSKQLMNPESVSGNEIANAAQQVAIANSNYANLANNPNLFAQVCADIKNPAAAISNFANSYLASALNQVNAPKPGNLPFFANFVENVATNFLTTIVNGGTPSTQLLTDTGFQAANIASTELLNGITEAKTLKDLDNATKDPVVFSSVAEATPGFYRVSWNASAVAGAARVEIISGSSTLSNLPISGQAVMRSTPASVILLRVLDSNNRVITTSNFTNSANLNPNVVLPEDKDSIEDSKKASDDAENKLKQDGLIQTDPPTNGSSSQVIIITKNNSKPTVAGVSTLIPSFTIRGPAVEFGLRGLPK